VLTLRFSDNALLDVEGPDLYVFEIGPDIEPTDLAISEDGVEWIEVGGITGGRADIDIAELTPPGAVFHSVRLTDDGRGCSGAWPGADIDAVGAIGAGRQISLDSSLLFNTGKFDLKPKAETMLAELAAEIAVMQEATVAVEGHTDSVGSTGDNQTLSESRTQSVMSFLKAQNGTSGFEYRTHGYGETRPVATNETDEGRARNRRVDLVVVPK
jgi:OOP family OmpA-OmpF porin